MKQCEHPKTDEAIPMTLLESQLGYRIVAHTTQDGHPGQLQNLDNKGHVHSCRPASNVEVQLFGILTTGRK